MARATRGLESAVQRRQRALAAADDSGPGSAHAAGDGPVLVHFDLPDTEIKGFGLSIVATPANGCPDYTYLWKLLNVEHPQSTRNYINVSPTVKVVSKPAKQSTLHVTLKCTVPASVRRVQPDYWTRPCESTITFLVKVTDKQGKKSLDKDSMVKFNWRPQCLTKDAAVLIENDENRIEEEARGDAAVDLGSEGAQHALTTVAEWESLGAALLARGALSAENKIGNLFWSWQLDQAWLQNKC
ncbi:MAG: hypothetical protein ACLP01_20295 [Solirubrobacteraceae bacterium]